MRMRRPGDDDKHRLAAINKKIDDAKKEVESLEKEKAWIVAELEHISGLNKHSYQKKSI